MKNKHNTMNSSSSQKTYLRMQHQLLKDAQSTCMLVEVIAKRSQNIPWTISLDGQRTSNKSIRRVSVDQFYALATGKQTAFCELCEVLPSVIDKVLSDTELDTIVQNTVLQEFLDSEHDSDILKSIFKNSFSTYAGFTNFKWR